MSGKRDPRVDAYIAAATPFAQPILKHVRTLVHQACPDVQETIKWSMPTFMHCGSILAGMAAFKQHASFGFWKHAQVMGEGVQRNGMGSYGRLQAVSDLPADKRLLADIGKAMRLNEQAAADAPARKSVSRKLAAAGTTAAAGRGGKRKAAPQLPDDFAAALGRNRKAQTSYADFPPGAQREYVDWITEAKRNETRARRIAQAVEWLAEGKRRNWKYEGC